jgi:RecA-family ATPase
MVSSGERQGKTGGVERFLLIPDPGNWLHPPHLEPGEVIHVSLEGARTTTLLTRTAVIVRGVLSVSPAESSGKPHYYLTAADVQIYAR